MEQDDPVAGAVHERVEAREELRQLRVDLAALPLRQRSALLLRELNGFSHKAVGEALETTAADARHLAARGPHVAGGVQRRPRAGVRPGVPHDHRRPTGAPCGRAR